MPSALSSSSYMPWATVWDLGRLPGSTAPRYVHIAKKDTLLEVARKIESDGTRYFQPHIVLVASTLPPLVVPSEASLLPKYGLLVLPNLVVRSTFSSWLSTLSAFRFVPRPSSGNMMEANSIVLFFFSSAGNMDALPGNQRLRFGRYGCFV